MGGFYQADVSPCIGGETALKIESAVEILSGDPALSERAVADFPVRVTAAISFWHDGRLHVCGGHSEYPAQEPDRMDSIFVSALIYVRGLPLSTSAEISGFWTPSPPLSAKSRNLLY